MEKRETEYQDLPDGTVLGQDLPVQPAEGSLSPPLDPKGAHPGTLWVPPREGRSICVLENFLRVLSPVWELSSPLRTSTLRSPAVGLCAVV